MCICLRTVVTMTSSEREAISYLSLRVDDSRRSEDETPRGRRPGTTPIITRSSPIPVTSSDTAAHISFSLRACSSCHCPSISHRHHAPIARGTHVIPKAGVLRGDSRLVIACDRSRLGTNIHLYITLILEYCLCVPD